MSFRRIEYFLSVAKHLNFTKAARECYVAQAAISQQIKQFEEELGFKLFNRGGASVSLTPAGGVLCQTVPGGAGPVQRGGEAGPVPGRGEEAGPPVGDQRPLYPGSASQTISAASASSTPRRPSPSRRGPQRDAGSLGGGEAGRHRHPDYGLALDQRFDVLELSSERPKFMTGPPEPAGRAAVCGPSELAGQTIFRIEGSVGESPNQARADYLDQLGLGANPVRQVKTFLEASILVQAGLGIAPPAGGDGEEPLPDVSVFSIEGTPSGSAPWPRLRPR